MKTNIFREQHIRLANGQICTLRLLKGKEDAKSSLELQDEILRTIEDETFISPKTEEDFLRASDDIHGITIGAFVDGKLVGQRSLYARTEDHHRTTDTERLNVEQSALIAGAKVLPEFRGNRITEHIGSILETIAIKNGFRYLTVETNASNGRSYSISLRNGFFIGKAVVDPSDGTLSFILFKPLVQESVFSDDTIDVIYDGSNQAKLLTLIAQGYYGTSCTYDRATGITTLHFRRFAGLCECARIPSSLPRLITQ